MILTARTLISVCGVCFVVRNDSVERDAEESTEAEIKNRKEKQK